MDRKGLWLCIYEYIQRFLCAAKQRHYKMVNFKIRSNLEFFAL